MDYARSVISSSAVPFRAAGDGAGQVFLFGGDGYLRGLPLVGGASAAAGAGAADGRRKRAFQLTTAHEELELGDDDLCGLDYELHLHGTQQERTTKRRLTAEQVRELELSFEEEKRKLEPERKSELARRLGIAPRQVAVWFQNRRARWRTKQLEQDFDRLRAAHHDLLAGRDKLLADNDRLRSQVITLTEKLQAKESSASAYALLEEDKLCSEIATGSAAAPAPGINDSPESYFAGARSPPSSPEDDDCGCRCDAEPHLLTPGRPARHGRGAGPRAAQQLGMDMERSAVLGNTCMTKSIVLQSKFGFESFANVGTVYSANWHRG